ncbi:pilus assembly protein PilM [Fictibacillus sp. Mic-4]|uniref:type IV pilus biogenesis protein PilM n=1 Tax=Fictibacillus sp. Mic-4 TaxID=3132826 RepID=UPI003CEC3A09
MGITIGRKNRRVNLLIADHVIRFLEMKEAGIVKNYGERYLPDGVISRGEIMDEELFVTILEQCVDEWGIKKREVQFLVQDSQIALRKQLIPVTIPEHEIKGYVYMELGHSIHLPFEDPLFDYEVIGRNEEQQEILLFAAPDKAVMGYTDVLEEVKLKPVVADISFLSLYRLFHFTGQSHPGDHLLCLQFDLSAIQLSIFHDDKPLFSQHFRMNIEMKEWQKRTNGVLYKNDETSLNGALEDSMVEIERVLNYYRFTVQQGNQGVTKILLTGDFPDLKLVEKRLTETFFLPVERIALQVNVPIEPGYEVIFGLGLKGAV